MITRLLWLWCLIAARESVTKTNRLKNKDTGEEWGDYWGFVGHPSAECLESHCSEWSFEPRNGSHEKPGRHTGHRIFKESRGCTGRRKMGGEKQMHRALPGHLSADCFLLSLTFLRSLFKGLSMVSFLPSPEANFPVLPILEHSAFDRRRPGGCMVRKSADESLNHLPFSVFSLRNLGRHLTNHWLCS